jgi:tetratricopeptide (TPR) repeat protein
LLYGFMGRKEEAIAAGRRAVELEPETRDAVDGTIMNSYLALIYTRVGEREQALALIERQLKTPSASDSVHYSVSLQDLRHRWEWDPVRDDPRFQRLIAQENGAAK